jgi:hypothetical protein
MKNDKTTIGFILLAIAFLLFAAVPTWATNKPKPMPAPTQEQGQQQKQHQQQKQGQDQSQTQSIGDQANSQSITFTSPDDIRIENTASPDTPNIYPQNPCALVWSAGGSVAGFAASGGKAYIDRGCEVRAWAALMFQLGAREAALYRLCMEPQAEGVPDCQGVRDYNKELQLLSLGHDQLVEENAELRDRIEFVLSERAEDQQRCDQSVERVGDELERCLEK